MQMHQTTPQSRMSNLVPAIGSLGLLIAGGTAIYLINPVSTRLIPPCPMLWATGCYCPGCGAARAFHALVRGDIGTAFGYNPLLILMLPALTYVYLSFLGDSFFERRLPAFGDFRAWTWLIPVVFIVYTIARNLPWEPFIYLAP